MGASFRFPSEDVLGSETESVLPERVESEGVESGKMEQLSSECNIQGRE